MDKLRFYDFMGFLLPGVFLIVFLYLLGALFHPGLLAFCGSEGAKTFGETIWLLIFAFLVGQVVQTCGNGFEVEERRFWGRESFWTAKSASTTTKEAKRQPLVWIVWRLPFMRDISVIGRWVLRNNASISPKGVGDWYSKTLLHADNPTYTQETKQSIRTKGEAFFGLQPLPENTSEKETEARDQTLFEMAYRFILQKDVAPHTEDFNAQYGFYRGMCVATGVAFWISTIIAAACAVVWRLILLGWVNCPACPHPLRNAAACVCVAVAMSWLFVVYRRRFERFAFYFANSVYMNFLVHIKTQVTP